MHVMVDLLFKQPKFFGIFSRFEEVAAGMKASIIRLFQPCPTAHGAHQENVARA